MRFHHHDGERLTQLPDYGLGADAWFDRPDSKITCAIGSEINNQLQQVKLEGTC